MTIADRAKADQPKSAAEVQAIVDKLKAEKAAQKRAQMTDIKTLEDISVQQLGGRHVSTEGAVASL